MKTETALLTGFFMIVGQIILATGIVVLSKYAFVNSDINPFFFLFLRQFLSVLLLLPFILPVFLKTYKTHNFLVSFQRSAINITALALWSFGYAGIPLSVATTFTFAVPVFTIFIAEFYLKERVTIFHKIVLGISIFGIILALRPSFTSPNIHYVITLLATFLWSISNIVRRISSTKTDFKTWICYYSFWSAILTFLFALPFFSKVPLYLVPIIVIAGILTAITNYLLFNIYKDHEASFVQSFDFLRLVFVSIADVFIFKQSLSLYIFIGSFFIIASSILFLWNEKNKVRAGIKSKKPVIGKIDCLDPEVY